MEYNFNRLRVKILSDEQVLKVDNINQYPHCSSRVGIERRNSLIGKSMFLVKWSGHIYNVEKNPEIYTNLAEYIVHDTHDYTEKD